MDPLELSYDDMDSCPEAYRGLYNQQEDGKVVFNVEMVNGMKTLTDVNNVQEALRKERNDRQAADAALKPWKAFGDPAEVQAKLDRIPELEAAAEGKLDDDKINGIVEQRISQKTAPLNRQVQTLTEENTTLKEENTGLKNQILTRDRNEAVRAVAVEMKVLPEALADVEMIVGNYLERDETTGTFIVKADANGVTPGADIKQAMKDMQRLRPYWWPASQGGGANPSAQFGGQANPWHADSWSVTRQGEVMREQGQEVANNMAKAAGSYIGATKPAKKK